jgi:Ca2+-binding RTX toxin-like protein
MSTLTAGRTGDTITGTADGDSITGSTGSDVIFGRQGGDTINGVADAFGATHDLLRGNAGDDSISLSGGNGLTFGDNGDDTLTTNASDGITVFEGGPGNDLIDGHLGIDPNAAWASYLTATSGVAVDLRITSAQAVGGGADVDILRGLNGLVGSPFTTP